HELPITKKRTTLRKRPHVVRREVVCPVEICEGIVITSRVRNMSNRRFIRDGRRYLRQRVRNAEGEIFGKTTLERYLHRVVCRVAVERCKQNVAEALVRS